MTRILPHKLTLLAASGVAVLLAGYATNALYAAQEKPESLLPQGYDRPPPRAKPAVAAPSAAVVREAGAGNAPVIPVAPVVPLNAAATGEQSGEVAAFPEGVSSLTDVTKLPQDQLDQLLGLRPRYDIPPAARRAMQQVGVIGAHEGGLPPFALALQNGDLVAAALDGNGGNMVSRWGHILLRRALASRMDAPQGMNPADFIAKRAALLVRMGEGGAARALVQDVDIGNYNAALTNAAFDAYIASGDMTGICPVMSSQGGLRKDGQWRVMAAICQTFSGNGTAGFAQLDRLTYSGALPRIDMLLAQKYAGAAGASGKAGGRRAVTIEWANVSEMSPWRFAFTNATGLTPPDELMAGRDGRYDYAAAQSPILGLGARADAADRAGGVGILSAAAMVDLYSQIYSDDGVKGGAADRALLLRDAYVGDTPAARLDAMRKLWGDAGGPLQRYARLGLTAYAAARLPVGSVSAQDMPDVIAAMLAAGLDANAMRWMGAADVGGQAWALLVLAAPGARSTVSSGDLKSFRGQDSSDNYRKSAFLLAGLAGLGRVSGNVRTDFAEKLGVDLDRPSRWTKAIDAAATARNPALVALLVGLGMQGDAWDKMTPRYLYHIVAGLHAVGMDAEARMIAAEAVARG
jgi:hypothetical protein